MPHHAAKASYAPGPGPLDQRSRAEIASRPAWVDRALFPFQSRFADVDGHRMHYLDEGHDHQRSAWTRHRETSLPEPMPTAALLDPLDPAERAQSLSIAFLLLLQALTPVERAVFLLRDVFDLDYVEIAAVVAKSEDNCRQVARRARQHLAAGRPRFEATRAEAAAIAERFSALCRAGDCAGLTTLLAPDATFVVDAGAAGLTYGKARAIDRPMHGAETIARFLIGVQRQAPGSMRHRVADVNGQPGLLVFQDGALHSVFCLDVGDGRVRGLYLIGDPGKLGRLRAAAS